MPAEDLASRAAARCTPLLRRPDVPEHVRALTSRSVLAVETEIPVQLVQQPLESVVLGAGRCVEAYDDLKVMFMGGRAV